MKLSEIQCDNTKVLQTIIGNRLSKGLNVFVLEKNKEKLFGKIKIKTESDGRKCKTYKEQLILTDKWKILLSR